MDHKIRPAREADRAAIIAIHLESWRDSYAGILPDRFLRCDLPQVLQDRWDETDFAGDDLTLVAEGAGLLGFVAVVAGEVPYIYNLHVAPVARGAGIGRRLIGRAATILIDRGASETYLHVLAANTRTRALYRRLGGIEDAPFQEELFGQKVETVTVRWPDLRRLRDLATA